MLLDMQGGGGQDMTSTTTSSMFHIHNTHTFFITDPFTKSVLCLEYPRGIGATLAFHDFCNDI